MSDGLINEGVDLPELTTITTHTYGNTFRYPKQITLESKECKKEMRIRLAECY